ncbi:MAG: ribose-phosphate diphosphokinase [Planctomycetota bacterium]|nr:ribose-phosphate diphosphokinase [Planctomycetota bacterium]
MAIEGIKVFGGSGSQRLTRNICRHLGIEPGRGECLRFSEGNLFVRILENVRGGEIYIVQSTAFPANDNFMELLFWIDAFKRASASSVTAVIPYFSYAKGDKKDEPRVSIRARVCADAIEAAGADRVVTMDLHAPQIQGFFRVPVDDLYAMPVLCEAIRSEGLSDLVIVAPDTGFARKAKAYAHHLKASLAIGYKQRTAHDENARAIEIVGDVAGKTVLLVDDFTISGGTLISVAGKAIEKGARDVYAAISHGVFAKGAAAKIDASPLKRVYVTDTVETQPETLPKKVSVVSAASLFAEAIRRIHNRESISVLFPD